MALMEIFTGKRLGRGLHVPDHKEATNHLPIRRLPFAPMLVVPLSQHTGAPAIPIVHEGQEVVRGEPIAKAGGFVSVPMHAPATGRVARIALAPSARGDLSPAIYISPYQGASQEVLYGAPQDIERMTPAEIVQAVQNTGVVGLGGAAFPTHVKLKVPEGKKIDTVVVNGCECEPYLTTDHRVMLEQPDEVLHGARIAMRALGAARAVIGVEDNKLDAVDGTAGRGGGRYRYYGGGRAGEVPAGRRENAGQGSARARDSVRRVARRCRAGGFQRRDAGADRRTAAAEPGTDRARGDDHGSGRSQAGKLSGGARYAAAVGARTGGMHRSGLFGDSGRSHDGRGRGIARYADHQRASPASWCLPTRR